MPGLGDELRAAREARGLTVSDVSEKIHIRSVYLQNIEDEDWAALVAPVYVRGFIRTYARFLGLDPERAVERFNVEIGEREPARPVATAPAASTLRAPAERNAPSPWLWVAAAIALVLVGLIGYNYYQLQTSSGSAPVAAASNPPVVTSPPAEAAATPKAVPSPKRTIEVRVTQNSWLLVLVDGKQALEGIFPPGTRKAFHGKSAVVRTGNAGGVDVSVNGHDEGTMGPAGDVVEKTFALARD